jgi:hypothetical protein
MCDNYKNKYLKYKNKYLNYKNNKQIGGLRTVEVPEVTLKTEELTHHNINCPDNQILKKLYLRRTHPPPRKIYYEFTCDKNNIENPDNFELPTELNDYGNGNTVYLDRHNIECPPGFAVSKIKLNKVGDQINYDYRCTNADLYDITKHETKLDADGSEYNRHEFGKIYYLDRHNVECPDGKYLNSIRLVRDKDPSGNLNKYKYIYTCGSMVKDDKLEYAQYAEGEASARPQVIPSKTQEQIDREIEDEKIRKWSKQVDGYNGHIKAYLQERILNKTNSGGTVTSAFERLVNNPHLGKIVNDFMITIKQIITSKDESKINELKTQINNFLEYRNKVRKLKGNDNIKLLEQILQKNNIENIDSLEQNINYDNLARIYINYNNPHTQSHVWCPLIWCALQRAGENIPSNWCNLNFYDNPKYEKIFHEEIKSLSENKEWVEHAKQILLN